MSAAFEATKVSEHVYWVGAIDWDIRNFHGYLTSRGTTYNAYLIVADKPVLIDTVKAPFFDEMLARISSVIDPADIDWIVSNHAEMDHSGSLVQAMDVIKPEKVFAAKMGKKALEAHFHDIGEITAVENGQVLGLGNLKLSCVETRMCHWPDSMVTYLHEDELLFSQDAFGMHLASRERFADELDREILDHEAAKYFANILTHLDRSITRALDTLDELGIPLSIVAPDHGPIWRTPGGIAGIVGSYRRWCSQEPSNKAVVIYDTMWQSTAEVARAVGDGIASLGAQVKVMSMDTCHRSDVVTELLDAAALVIGSPTLNNNIFPSIADVMTYIKGLRPRNKVAAAFGSFGWSGEAPKHLTAMLEEMGLDIVADPLRIKYVPDADALGMARELGAKVAQAMAALVSGESAVADGTDQADAPEAPQVSTVTIDVNNGARTIQAATDRALFDILSANGILLPTICGGVGICGRCKVRVLEGEALLGKAEKELLSTEQLADGIRLACQVVPTSDMKIIVPDESVGAV